MIPSLPKFIGAGGGAVEGLGWADFYELDFTAQTPAALVNGAWVDSNGKSWTYENAAQASTNEVSVANGLHRIMSGNGVMYGSTRTAPILGINLADLGTIVAGDRLSVMFRGNLTTTDVAYNGFGVLVENAGKTLGLSGSYQRQPPNNAWGGFELFPATLTDWFKTGSTFTNVLEVEYGDGPTVTLRDGGAWTGEWPTPGAGTLVANHGLRALAGAIGFTPFTLASARFGFIAERFGGAPVSKVYAFKIRRQSAA